MLRMNSRNKVKQITDPLAITLYDRLLHVTKTSTKETLRLDLNKVLKTFCSQDLGIKEKSRESIRVSDSSYEVYCYFPQDITANLKSYDPPSLKSFIIRFFRNLENRKKWMMKQRSLHWFQDVLKEMVLTASHVDLMERYDQIREIVEKWDKTKSIVDDILEEAQDEVRDILYKRFTDSVGTPLVDMKWETFHACHDATPKRKSPIIHVDIKEIGERIFDIQSIAKHIATKEQPSNGEIRQENEG